MRLSCTAVLVSLVYITSFLGSTRAGILTNGGFELPALATNTATAVWIGDPSLTGWTVGGAPSSVGIGLVNGYPALYSASIGAVEGAQFIYFNGGGGTAGGTVSQMFQTKPGHAYDVSFNVGKTGSAPGFMEITSVVTAGNGSVLGLLAASQTSTGWGPTNGFSFTATTTNSTLTFYDTSSATTNTDVALDNVSVEPVRPPLSIYVSCVDICWPSLTNTFYQVQYRSDLTTNAWTDFGAPVQGNGSAMCYTDNSVRQQPQRFYRVVELP